MPGLFLGPGWHFAAMSLRSSRRTARSARRGRLWPSRARRRTPASPRLPCSLRTVHASSVVVVESLQPDRKMVVVVLVRDFRPQKWVRRRRIAGHATSKVLGAHTSTGCRTASRPYARSGERSLPIVNCSARWVTRPVPPSHARGDQSVIAPLRLVLVLVLVRMLVLDAESELRAYRELMHDGRVDGSGSPRRSPKAQLPPSSCHWRCSGQRYPV